ncbi:hypothetical protein DNU06_06495 [Putridiphycobacter roseus]|uniref:C2 domain-containing protein n=1 Tax=Putridiphycobacter roseus TaxID=2219161 RepID=A0A2W1NPB1_9FLAO|nr:hypothetical protein DNU06_06495 [Putridiphycobacter roseus]
MFTACQKKGCQTIYAINYSPSAEKQDGSCIYYTKGNISKIELSNFPKMDLNNEPWDADSPADIFIRYTDSMDVVKYQTAELVDVNDVVSWIFPLPIGFNKNEGVVYFKVYEADDFTVESMGIIPLDFDAYMHEANNELNKYPDSIMVSQDEIELKIFVDWTV